ncbi:MAG TPA: tetratricopeptide repeat protein [Opitutaceae bacterium]|nr:tetratricopeptide repeat protein [Opitutaceae bacterium]
MRTDFRSLALLAITIVPMIPAVGSTTDVAPAALAAVAVAAKDNSELEYLYEADQSDRTPNGDRPIDWKTIEPRDQERQRRVKELYTTNQLQTGGDYYNAAMVLQHADAPEDYLLAHELCIVAVSKGDRDALWLAAASEDRFLESIKRPQRFGTQFTSDGSTSPASLYEMEEGVTDELRAAFDVPTPADAKVREAIGMYPQEDLFIQEGKLTEAEAIERRMLDLVRASKDGRILGAFLIKLAQTLNQEKKYAAAEPLAREGLLQRTKAFSPTSWQIFSAQTTLGRSLLGQKKVSEAEPLLISAYAGLKQSEATIPNQFKLRIKETAECLAQLYETTDKPAKAKEWAQKITEFDLAQKAPN